MPAPTDTVIDNEVYSRIADTWWTEDSVLCLLRHHLNPCRFDYFDEVLEQRLGKKLANCRVLDVGCGGGFLTEEFAKRGCEVVGVDPSAESIEVARAHAIQSGLDITYHVGYAEHLPCDDASFDVICCCDVLEHVQDLEQVIADATRVLKPDGVYCFDTVNRTFISWLFYIKIAQEWSWTSYIPENLHDWRMFVRPKELTALFANNGMAAQDFVGMGPNINGLRVVQELRRLKTGKIDFRGFADQMKTIRTRDMACSYMGYATKV
ncbi:bifunctional 2-polyprenyl-6-hydroxyphenol methylase/3-demethylubiquinol 3-O-methyltransferase UbiG [Bremerella alba]|uniref:Ubiquinone biosynthesis O-methyltransferase n=1 Tax=Bremerella alba TaxID=980252 RepID=A0A7V8V7L6_9BACT|nr:bifunctional 2-polyprenyl-6-hydroxyphenol methylase/3-demethylubiquinol 3-O-methyltransferase UbiG [Bremerella alba]MBA2116425.1 Ubiquinone biosynthesis O-methyltransferase [Bremerella alba]